MLSQKDILLESMKRLGWDDVRGILARHAASESGARECVNLQPFPDFQGACAASRASAEMTELLSAKPAVPACGFKNILPLLLKASKETALEPQELKAVAGFVRVLESIINYFKKKSMETIPNLLPLVQSLLPFPNLLRSIEGVVGDEGEIRENASLELVKLRRRVHSLRNAVVEKVERILDSAGYTLHLQDRYYTERENRYVIPIKAESRSKCRGIVHGVSGSGSTLFLEPEELVDMNNNLKITELEIQREVARILRETTREIAFHGDALSSNFHVLTRMDVIQATARFGEEMEASYVELTESGGILLKDAKHPVLLAEKKESTVENTFETGAETHGIIISGPNTGGKTVTLKMIGLMALMAGAGLPLPVGAGSKMPFFSNVYADIGDEQSIHLNLSTFSAHLLNIIHVMRSAESNSLVLLDELMISTEPVEGAALAESIFLHFVEKKIRLVVTTHYNTLKALGQARTDCLNIGFGFDLESMAPTYRLTLGLPEKSSPMEIALRLGMERGIMERAVHLLRHNDRWLEDFLSQLSEEKKRLEKEMDVVRSQRQELEELESEKRQMLEKIRSEKEEFGREKRKRLTMEIIAAKKEIKEILDNLKSEPSKNRARKIEGQLNSFVRPSPDLSQGSVQIPWELLRPGDMVEIPDLKARGELLETPVDKKSVRVKIGNFESSVKISLIKGYERKSGDQQKKAEEKKSALSICLDESYSRSFGQECDLRGMAGDEAINVLAGFLDSAVLEKIYSVRVIHGIGKGVLKNKVLDFLGEFPFPCHFRPGFPYEGGDGVTVVEFDRAG